MDKVWRQILAGAAMVLLCLGAVRADGPFPDMLSTADRDRLSRYEPVRKAILRYAYEHATPAQLAILESVLLGTARDIPLADLQGEWRCRTLELTRSARQVLLAHEHFTCQIAEGLEGLRLQQLNGPRRLAGAFYDIGETKLGYVGAVARGDGASSPRYGQAPQYNRAGYLIIMSRHRMRLEFPLPPGDADNDFEILELWRPTSAP